MPAPWPRRHSLAPAPWLVGAPRGHQEIPGPLTSQPPLPLPPGTPGGESVDGMSRPEWPSGRQRLCGASTDVPLGALRSVAPPGPGRSWEGHPRGHRQRVAQRPPTPTGLSRGDKQLRGTWPPPARASRRLLEALLRGPLGLCPQTRAGAPGSTPTPLLLPPPGGQPCTAPREPHRCREAPRCGTWSWPLPSRRGAGTGRRGGHRAGQGRVGGRELRAREPREGPGWQRARGQPTPSVLPSVAAHSIGGHRRAGRGQLREQPARLSPPPPGPTPPNQPTGHSSAAGVPRGPGGAHTDGDSAPPASLRTLPRPPAPGTARHGRSPWVQHPPVCPRESAHSAHVP